LVNSGLIQDNAASILANSGFIATNTQGIATNASNIGFNAAAIGLNREAINSLRDGSAAIAAMPDLYLGSDETWSIAGGFSLYDDGFGGTETGFAGGLQIRLSTTDKWSVGVAGALSGAAATVRLQGRIGG